VDALGPGTHPVSLTVTDSLGGTGTSSTTLKIYDNRPFASFTANPNPAVCGQVVQFDGRSSSHGRPDRSIVSYGWDFGDGTEAGSGAVVSHAYAAYGSYTVLLRVTDNNIPAKIAETTVVVTVNQGNLAPVANTGGPYAIAMGSGVTFNGAASSDPNAACGDSIVSYAWDLDNNYVYDDAFGATPSLTDAQITSLGLGAGTHTIRLAVTDTFGAIGTASTTLTINPYTITANTTGNGFGTVQSSVGGINYHYHENNTATTTPLDYRTLVTLTATPDEGSIFEGWSGDPDCADGEVTVDAIKTCIATFSKCVAPPTGLVAWWSGDGHAFDLVGSNNGTMMNGATYAAGKLGKGFSFDGIDDYVLVPHHSSLSPSTLTVEAWVYMYTTSGLRNVVFKGDHQYLLIVNSGRIKFGSKNSSGEYSEFEGSLTVSENTWTHVAITHDGSTKRIYVNGQLDPVTEAQTGLYTGDTNQLHIGTQYHFVEWFYGLIDEVQIYNRALTDAEILAIYNAGAAGKCKPCFTPPSGMVSWWKGENNVNDSVGSNHGTVNGATFDTGMVGQAFKFDGVDDYVDAGTSDVFNFNNGIGDFTIDSWINLSEYRGSSSGIVAKATINPFTGWGFYVIADTLRFGGVGVWEIASSTGVIPMNSWTHVAVTKNGSIYRLYKNGLEVASLNYGNLQTSNTSLRVGTNYLNGEFFPGLIDEVEIFNRALTAEEIAAIYAAGSAGKCIVDTAPDQFSFIDQTDVPLNTLIESNAVTVTGINYSAYISITNGEYSVSTNGGSTWSTYSATTPALVNLNDQVKVRQTSSSSFSTKTDATLTIGGVSDTFSVTTLAADTTPDAFSFVDQSNVALNTVITSNTITVSGINTGAPISITGGEYEINNSGTWTNVAGRVYNGNTVRMRQTSSSNFSTQTDGTLTIGGISDAFSVTTAAPDATPDPFAFIDRTGVGLSAVITSNTISVSGINIAATISITGGIYAINGGSYTSAGGTVNNGDTVKVQQTSSGSYSTTTNATLTIGGVSDAFSVTTAAPDANPDQFIFTDRTSVALNTVITSNTITVAGTNTAAPISIVGGQYAINGGSYTSAGGTVNNGDTVSVQRTSSESYSTTTNATLTIGGVSDTFSVTTQDEPVGDTWTQKADFGGTERYGAVGFSIGSRGYIGTGLNSSYSYTRDFWEYDPAANTWTQKADFGGTERYGAVGFSIGSKGYIGTGFEVSYSRTKDFWEYDPAANTWTQKADFGGTERYGAVGFSIGSKGYIGTGSIEWFGGASLVEDFWEYDQTANTWTEKAAFGGRHRDGAVGFSIGSKGYVGTGYNGSYTYDFWEYDPALNAWTQKANFGPIVPQVQCNAVGFSIGSKGYIGTGFIGSYTKDFWEYEPALNTWTQKADFGGIGRYMAVGFSIGSKGYIGTGDGEGVKTKDFWEYEPADTTPDQFTFTDQTGVALSSVITSNIITVAGINAAVTISIVGGQYAINGGSYTSADGTVNNGNTVTVQQTSSASYSTTTDATLTIGGISDTFSVTTLDDTTPPTPNPMTWATPPSAAGSTSISMVATTATDTGSPPVSYYFDFVDSPTGGTGGADAGWQSSASYTNAGLQPNHQYGYQVKARDSAPIPNETFPSTPIVYRYTLANAPLTASFADVTQNCIRANWTVNENRSGTEYWSENTTNSTNSGWTTNLYWDSCGLTCDTSYGFRVKARNGDEIETGWTSLGPQITQACPDTTGPSLLITSHSDGQLVNATSMTLSGTASDSGKGGNGIQQVTVNGGRANNDTATGTGTANWSKAVSLSPGANTLTVIAYDNSSNHNQSSQTITVYYDLVSTIYVSKDGVCNGHSYCWSNIQNGISTAPDSSIIEITQETYDGNIVLDVDKEIILEGGWDTNFTLSSSYTTINGSITITNGTIIIENIIFK
jgi:hypothetical protein